VQVSNPLLSGDCFAGLAVTQSKVLFENEFGEQKIVKKTILKDYTTCFRVVFCFSLFYAIIYVSFWERRIL
jgi:hypothetical protein